MVNETPPEPIPFSKEIAVAEEPLHTLSRRIEYDALLAALHQAGSQLPVTRNEVCCKGNRHKK